MATGTITVQGEDFKLGSEEATRALTQRSSTLAREASKETGIAVPANVAEPGTAPTMEPEETTTTEAIDVPEMDTGSDAGAQTDAQATQDAEEVRTDQELLQEAQEAAQRTVPGVESAQQDRDESLSAVQRLLKRFEQKPEARQDIEEDLGIPEERKELNEVNKTIAQTQVAKRERVKEIRDTPGLTTSDVNLRTQTAERKFNFDIANQQIIKNAMTNNLTRLQDAATRKLNLQFEPLEKQLQFQKTFLERNQDILDRKQTARLQQTIAERQRLLTEQKEEAKALQTRKNELLIQAASAGAGATTLQSIENADTREEALQIAAPFVSKLGQQQQAQTQLELAQQRADLQQTRAATQVDLSELSGEGGGGQLNFKEALSLRGDAQGSVPQLKNLSDVLDGFNTLKSGVNAQSAQGDLAIVSGLARILDPGSVVRPSEFETVKQAQGVLERAFNIPAEFARGETLKPSVRQKFSEIADAVVVAKTMAVKSQLEDIAGGTLDETTLNQIAPEVRALDNMSIDAKRDALENIAENAQIEIDVNGAFDLAEQNNVSKDKALEAIANEIDRKVIQPVTF